MITTKSDRYSAPHMTKVEGYPDSTSARAGMAYLSGSGPAGETCGSCLHLDGNARKKGSTRCKLYKKFCAGRTGAVIDPKYAACKYFEPRPKPKPIIAKHRPLTQPRQISAAEAAILSTINTRVK